MLVSFFATTSAALTRYPIQCGCARAWAREAHGEIGLLPFPIDAGLLPGESLQIHLSSDSSLALLNTAMRRDHGCISQLVERSTGSAFKAAPLLELREHQSLDIGIWCSFVCVGAVCLSGSVRLCSDEGSEPFLVATNARSMRESDSSVDYYSADDEEAYLSLEVERVFEEVRKLRRRALVQQSTSSSEEPASSGGWPSAADQLGLPPAVDDKVKWGHRLEPRIGPGLSLSGLIELRTDALCARGPDECPDSDLGRLQELWCTADAEATRRRMLSFAACEPLEVSRRMRALSTADTSTRLEHALEGLRDLKAALLAEIAVRQAIESEER